MSDRARIVAEARSWIGTPYHHAQRVKGAGVDCAQFLLGVFAALGFVEEFDPGTYPPDWMLHRDIERFLGFVGKHALPTENPQAGDVVLMRFGRTYSHGAILIDEHTLIHSHKGRGVVIDDRAEFSDRIQRFFTVIRP